MNYGFHGKIVKRFMCQPSPLLITFAMTTTVKRAAFLFTTVLAFPPWLDPEPSLLTC
jgi:hypothetical protein